MAPTIADPNINICSTKNKCLASTCLYVCVQSLLVMPILVSTNVLKTAWKDRSIQFNN